MNKYKILLIILTIHLVCIKAVLAQNSTQQNPTNQNPEFYFSRAKSFYITLQKAHNFVNSIVETSYKILNLEKLQPASTLPMSTLNWQYREEVVQQVKSYSRIGHFGKWVKSKLDKNCYNTRAKALIRDNSGEIKFSADNVCSVREGTWVDPYGGAVVHDALLVQIDHMVPLKEAFNSGAYKWTFKERCLYANYMGYSHHLISVDGEQNNNKGDKTPIDYLPPQKSYQCQYLKDWLFIKALWGLNMTEQEATFIKNKISELHCDQSQFTVTEAEIKTQLDYFSQNKELCAGVEKMFSNTQPQQGNSLNNSQKNSSHDSALDENN